MIAENPGHRGTHPADHRRRRGPGPSPPPGPSRGWTSSSAWGETPEGGHRRRRPEEHGGRDSRVACGPGTNRKRNAAVDAGYDVDQVPDHRTDLVRGGQLLLRRHRHQPTGELLHGVRYNELGATTPVAGHAFRSRGNRPPHLGHAPAAQAGRVQRHRIRLGDAGGQQASAGRGQWRRRPRAGPRHVGQPPRPLPALRRLSSPLGRGTPSRGGPSGRSPGIEQPRGQTRARSTSISPGQLGHAGQHRDPGTGSRRPAPPAAPPTRALSSSLSASANCSTWTKPPWTASRSSSSPLAHHSDHGRGRRHRPAGCGPSRKVISPSSVPHDHLFGLPGEQHPVGGQPPVREEENCRRQPSIPRRTDQSDLERVGLGQYRLGSADVEEGLLGKPRRARRWTRASKDSTVSSTGTVTPFRPVNTLTHVEGLGQEALDLPGPVHGDPVLLGQLVETEDGDDVLQLLIALEHALHPAGHVCSGAQPTTSGARMFDVEVRGFTAG